MASRTNQIAQPTRALREQINADVEEFLKSGKKITEIPSGVSGQESGPKSRHIKLGKPKKD